MLNAFAERSSSGTTCSAFPHKSLFASVSSSSSFSCSRNIYYLQRKSSVEFPTRTTSNNCFREQDLCAATNNFFSIIPKVNPITPSSNSEAIRVSFSKPEDMTIESKQRPKAAANGHSIANGTLAHSTTPSSDNGSNAWSTAGSAALDFRSA